MNDINYAKIFEVLDTFTGLPIKRKGDRWYGACYYDGAVSNRFDKLTCRLLSDGIQMLEQGNNGISIWSWLLRYGGCNDTKEAFQKLMNVSNCNIVVPPPKPKPPIRYVYNHIMHGEKGSIGVTQDDLFSYLASIFGIRRVITAYNRLNVTPLLLKNEDFENRIATNFWYVDKQNRILHDKIVLYQPGIGKRDRNFGGARRFKQEKGFYGSCYFGEHLLNEQFSKVYVVESEKTALISTLFSPKNLFLATGGKNCILHSEPDWVFLSDIDSWEYWDSKLPGQCPKWWLSYPEWPYGPKDDFGDYIIWLKTNKA